MAAAVGAAQIQQVPILVVSEDNLVQLLVRQASVDKSKLTYNVQYNY